MALVFGNGHLREILHGAVIVRLGAGDEGYEPVVGMIRDGQVADGRDGHPEERRPPVSLQERLEAGGQEPGFGADSVSFAMRLDGGAMRPSFRALAGTVNRAGSVVVERSNEEFVRRFVDKLLAGRLFPFTLVARSERVVAFEFVVRFDRAVPFEPRLLRWPFACRFMPFLGTPTPRLLR